MDPLAHTLVGATLAETRLGRLAPYAPLTLILGANLPDVDAILTFAGAEQSLLHRRGWTHGIAAMVVLPPLLAALVARIGRRPTSLRTLILLAYLSVWTHPVLDWLNTYGIRLLMPFDGTWFYGDSLFIVDPLLWLAGASTVVLAHSRSRRSIVRWLVLAVLTSLVVIVTPAAPLPVKLAWLAGITGLVALRHRLGTARAPRAAAAVIVGLALYAAAMRAGTLVAERQAARWLAERGSAAEVLMAGPLPGQPWARDVVAADAERYEFLIVDWLARPAIRAAGPPLTRSRSDVGIVARALAHPSLSGTRVWLRYPSHDIAPLPGGGFRVRIRDVRYPHARYVDFTRPGFATAIVDLPD